MTQESTLTHESASGRGSAAGEPRIALLLNGDGLAVNAIMLFRTAPTSRPRA